MRNITAFRQNVSKNFLYGVSVAALVSLGAGNAFAQVENDSSVREDTIIVTARKRAESLQDVPFSINAQTEEMLRRTGATSLEEAANNIAGFSVQNLGPGQSQVAIRGVSSGQIARDLPGVKEQVGVYLDESVISLSLFTPEMDFYDLNRLEVLGGPQGTLFGSGSEAGTLRYITNQPNPETYEASAEVTLKSVKDGDVGGDIRGMVNLRMGLRSGPWDVAVWVNNLFDETARLGLDRERGGRARAGFLTNTPRTVGVTLRSSF